MPALGVSLFLIAVGAVLAFAVTTTVAGVSIQAIGLILMGVGFLGIMMALLFLMSFSPWGSHGEGSGHGGGGTTTHVDVS